MAIRRVYWDSCVWLGLIKEEPDKLPRCQHVIQLARAGDVEIWTSALTLAEVFKVSQPSGSQSIPAASDEKFEDFLDQDFVVIAQVDVDTGHLARRLLRRHGKLKKPPDAIHLATAVINDLDEFHTFDGANLLPLNGEIQRANGVALAISMPPEPPIDPQGVLELLPAQEEAVPTGEDDHAIGVGVEAAQQEAEQAPGPNGVAAESREAQVPVQSQAPSRTAGAQG